MKLSSRIILSCLLSAAAASPSAVKYVVDATPGDDAGEPDRGFVSYSFELAFFPDYAGGFPSIPFIVPTSVTSVLPVQRKRYEPKLALVEPYCQHRRALRNDD